MTLISYYLNEEAVMMKALKLKLRSSFKAQSREQLRQAVTKKVEKLINGKPKKVS